MLNALFFFGFERLDILYSNWCRGKNKKGKIKFFINFNEKLFFCK